jgi:hypothetical protein
MFTGATIAIGLMYGGAFFFSAKTHLSVMEYWRWWVVHLWVEGFFEVFATAALALVFAKMGLVESRHAGRAVIASSTLFLFAGIPGTLHHLYFSGTPTSVLAVGATFSALEVVPLTLIGFEALSTLRLQHAAPYAQRYRWPIRFFVGVAFWNAVGAGFFGFLINPPIALYYMQGLNTTPVHAHSALFGVYGLLALGLCLIIARRLTGERPWNERALAVGFWCMNAGLALMIVLSLLPIGLAQTVASVDREAALGADRGRHRVPVRRRGVRLVPVRPAPRPQLRACGQRCRARAGAGTGGVSTAGLSSEVLRSRSTAARPRCIPAGCSRPRSRSASSARCRTAPSAPARRRSAPERLASPGRGSRTWSRRRS